MFSSICTIVIIFVITYTVYLSLNEILILSERSVVLMLRTRKLWRFEKFIKYVWKEYYLFCCYVIGLLCCDIIRGDMMWCLLWWVVIWSDVKWFPVPWRVGMLCDAMYCVVIRGDVMWCDVCVSVRMWYDGMWRDIPGCCVIRCDVLWCLWWDVLSMWFCVVMWCVVLSWGILWWMCCKFLWYKAMWW